MNAQALLEENIQLRQQVQHQAQTFTNQIKLLEEQLEWFKRRLFGKRSEKIVGLPGEMFLPGFEEIETQEKQQEQQVKGHKRKKSLRLGKDKLSFPEDLPVETTVLDIPEEEKICPKTGKPLVKIGEEVSQKLAHKPGSFYIKETIRPKYALPENEGVKTAPLPEGLLPRCLVDESLLAEIFTKKFGDHLPLYRISEILSREQIQISRKLLSQWVVRSGKALAPLYKELEKQILETKTIFIDETPVDMQMPGKGKTHTAYMWTIVGGAGPPYQIYHFRTSRKHEHAKELLTSYKGGFHADKYGAYEALAKREDLTWYPCFAHIRRKFYEAESGDPKFRADVLRKVRYLYMFEKIAWERSEEERLKIRQEKEAPIIDELIEKVKKRLIEGQILPKSKLREAIGYFCSLIPHLKNYITNPHARLDNNTAERAIRPLAIGRKNWLFMGSEEGGKAAAVLLSLVQSCRAVGVNPREYLEDVMRRLMDHSVQKLNELLPAEWAAIRNKQMNQPV
jgi:transposase